jgi:creatinine amidohydrolase
MPEWKNYEELRPDELEALVQRAPVAFWPLGLLEHHGWHLPIGYDGIKARRLCQRVAERTGGLILPTMWWGGGGGHDVFKWSHYQAPEATAAILRDTCQQLATFGFKALVLLAGHYPWQSLLDQEVPALVQQLKGLRIFWGTEMSICGEAVTLRGDHAAYEETSFGLALFPELIRQDALTPGRDDSVWPDGQAPPADKRHPQVEFDPAKPLFSQMGRDARQANADHGEAALGPVVDHLAAAITSHLQDR